MLCPDCSKEMLGPEYIKTRIPLPPVTDCPECEEFRKHGARLTFAKMFICVDCSKVITFQLTVDEIKAHRFEFHWGSIDIKEDFKEKVLKKAGEEEKVYKDAEKSVGGMIFKMNDRELLDNFVKEVNECPDVHKVYLVSPQQAPHMIEMGWIIIEVHIIPKGRPPYHNLETIFAKQKYIEEPVSEMFGERAMICVGEHIKIVRAIDNPIRLPHI